MDERWIMMSNVKVTDGDRLESEWTVGMYISFDISL
jgi:hypothetical protein